MVGLVVHNPGFKKNRISSDELVFRQQQHKNCTCCRGTKGKKETGVGKGPKALINAKFKKSKMTYATAKTLADRNRQVYMGKAAMTGPGGLTKKNLVRNKNTGQIVSKKRAKGNAFMQKMHKARKAGQNSFTYRGVKDTKTNTYVKDVTDTGMVMYRKKI
jgi:hypothetical protein